MHAYAERNMSKALLLPNKGSNEVLSPGAPLFETLEATFSQCNDSENEYLDDESVDDDGYEYNTDDDWKHDDEPDEDHDETDECITKAVTFAHSSNKKQSPFNKLQRAKSFAVPLSNYPHFMIRQITVHGDVRGNLETDQRERALIKKEIIETEKSYLKGLDVLLNEFIKPIFEQKMIPLQYEREVTCNIPMIINFHREFLKELQTQYDSDGDICAVFIKYADFMKMYNEYIHCYHNILDIFAKHNTSKKLKKHLKQKRMERKPLTNHLILPIQRIPRAVDIINKVAISINESKREIENMSQCLQVMENLRELNRNIVEPHRKFLDQFLFRKKDKGRPRQFFVFSDLIIITNLKFKVKMIVEMRTIDLKITKDPHIFSLFSAKGKPIQYQTDTADAVDDIITLHQLIIKSRNAVWDSYLSRVGTDGKSEQRDALKKSGVSQAVQYRNQLETLQRLREKKDESTLNTFKKSNLVKGKKDKVLEMLGQ
eukprot:665551_1